MRKLSVNKRKTFIQFLKFCIIGGTAFLFDTGLVYFGIYILGFTRTGAGLFSFPFVVTFTWLGNRHFTFHEASREKKGQQLMKFIAVCVIGLVFNRGTYSLLVNNVPLVYDSPVLGLIAGTGVAMFFNFFTAKKLVFR